MAKLLTTAYKSKIIKFKLGENPLQIWICVLAFIKSPEMIFLQYKETCEVLLDYPKIVGEDKNIIFQRQLGIFCMQVLMSIVEV